MATPVIKRMLAGKEWWAEETGLRNREDREADAIFRHVMLGVGRQEQVKLQAERAAERAAAQELRLEKETAMLRAEAHNLLAHCPDSWWEVVKDATTPPTCLVVLSVEMAEAACRLLRRFIKRRGKGSANTQNEAIIDELLVDAQEAFDFCEKRRLEGAGAALKIQKKIRAFISRLRVRERILTRFEKRWDPKSQAFKFVDAWGESAQRRDAEKQASKMPWDDDDDDDDDDQSSGSKVGRENRHTGAAVAGSASALPRAARIRGLLARARAILEVTLGREAPLAAAARAREEQAAFTTTISRSN
mmetsp:Transcript_34477/g.77947  ORF Transcript_34477/g.77947 Transcript_34477/m.77947 type:complete len:304 (+) Transcript_34477:50-961(+)